MLLIGGSASDVLSLKVGRELGMAVSKLQAKKFPDGEKYVRIMDNVKGDTVVVIQSMYHVPDEHLFEYFLLVKALKDLGAKRVIGVIPYFAYARQDRRFNPGEAISFQTVTRLIENVGTDELFTIDTHLHRVNDISKVFNIPAHNLSVVPLLTQYVKQNFTLDKPIVIAPDEEAEQWAKISSEILNCEYDTLEKVRLGPDKVEIKTRLRSVKDRNVVVIDDIISTGGTMVETIKVLQNYGANRVIVMCAHPLLIGDSHARILDAGAEVIIGSDTVPSPVGLVSAAPIIADAIRKFL
ncbi:MAG: ribose-phosphate diphosphokinase [Nitrososphaeria archaeon]|jgi:ribose-phosphate pyrophosphokinase